MILIRSLYSNIEFLYITASTVSTDAGWNGVFLVCLYSITFSVLLCWPRVCEYFIFHGGYYYLLQISCACCRVAVHLCFLCTNFMSCTVSYFCLSKIFNIDSCVIDMSLLCQSQLGIHVLLLKFHSNVDGPVLMCAISLYCWHYWSNRHRY